MDFVKNFTGGDNQQQGENQQQGFVQNSNNEQQQQNNGGGFMSGLKNTFNSAAGGGKESEANEDYLDKAVDTFQEKVLGQGPQDNESAVEQAKDEQISDYIRGQYKGMTGKDIPVKDKETRLG